MNTEILKELQEIEEMVKEAQEHEKYTEKYFIIREGMIKLAGGFAQAALLSSLIGWTRHWLKTDNEIYKQIKAAAEIGDIEKIRKLKQQIRQGWFWKSYREMSEELLGQVSIKTCQRWVEKFEEMGLISSRDPDEKATYRARWYKANIEKIKEELEKMGYQLDYYKDTKGICQNDKSQNQGVSEPKTAKPLISGICQNDKSCGQNDKSSGQNDKHLLYTSFNTSSFNHGVDDDGFTTSNDWENDFDYLAFRKRFVNAGADDIKDHSKHYERFKEAVNAIGYARFIEFAEKYISENRENSQICWFLGGGWKNYLPKRSSKQNGGQKAVMAKSVLMRLQQEQSQQQAGSTVTDEEAKERWKRKLAQLKKTDEIMKQRQQQESLGYDPLPEDLSPLETA